jgi:hypothetical protein
MSFRQVNRTFGNRPSLMGLVPIHLVYPLILVSALVLLPCIYLFQAPMPVTLIIWFSAIGSWYVVAGKYQKYALFMLMLRETPKGYYSGHVRYKPMFQNRSVKNHYTRYQRRIR